MFGGVVIVVVYVIVAPFHFLPFSDRQSPSSGNVSMEIAVAVVEFRFWSQEGEDSLDSQARSMQLPYE